MLEISNGTAPDLETQLLAIVEQTYLLGVFDGQIKGRRALNELQHKNQQLNDRIDELKKIIASERKEKNMFKDIVRKERYERK